MPLYEYQCDSCGTRFERIQKFSDPPVTACPACGGPVQKLPSSPAIQFKGSGWYITDYARKSDKPEKPAGAAEGEKKPTDATAGKESTKDTAKEPAGSGEKATPSPKPKDKS